MSTTLIGRRAVVAAALLVAPGSTMAATSKPKVAITTGRGVIVVELDVHRAPITAGNFLRYVDAKKYDGGTFFRAARTPGRPGEGDIVGDVAPKTHPYPPIAHESTTETGLRHLAGTISIGRFAPGSATSTFFICASPEPAFDAHPGAHGDNLGFAAFGQVVSGMPVVRRILAAHTSQKSQFADQKGQWLDPPIPIVKMARSG